MSEWHSVSEDPPLFGREVCVRLPDGSERLLFRVASPTEHEHWRHVVDGSRWTGATPVQWRASHQSGDVVGRR